MYNVYELYPWVSDCCSLGYIAYINELYSICIINCSLHNFTASAERIRNSGAQIYVCLFETFGACMHYNKMYTTLNFFKKSGAILCLLNEPSLFTKDSNSLASRKIWYKTVENICYNSSIHSSQE